MFRPRAAPPAAPWGGACHPRLGRPRLPPPPLAHPAWCAAQRAGSMAACSSRAEAKIERVSRVWERAAADLGGGPRAATRAGSPAGVELRAGKRWCVARSHAPGPGAEGARARHAEQRAAHTPQRVGSDALRLLDAPRPACQASRNRQDYDHLVKLLLIGDSGACMRRRAACGAHSGGQRQRCRECGRGLQRPLQPTACTRVALQGERASRAQGTEATPSAHLREAC